VLLVTFRREAVFRVLIGIALAGLLFAGRARAAEVYSYVDDEGVLHFSNAPTDARYRRVNRTSGGSGVYRPSPQARARPIGASSSTPRMTVEQWREHIRQAAEKYKLPEALLLAVMAVESNFDHQALSEKGAMGLMQLMPGTAKEMYVSDAWDPAQNIEGGARYLRILANQYGGDMVKTLAAYNAGPEAVRRAGGAVPGIPETQEYVRKVVALYQSFKAGR
jgi:soluble lytic murein transglycosylase-like protein